MRRAAVSVVFGALATFFPSVSPAADSLTPQVDALVKPLIESETVVGLAIGVIHDGRTETFAYGALGCDSHERPDQRTVFEIGSISKVFTGLLLADAVEQGHVRLDDPVAKYLPESVHVPAHGDRAITLVDLTTHTSGLPRMPGNIFPLMAKNPRNPYADYTADHLYEFLSKHTLEVAPGKRFLYSNLGVGLLGHALTRQAGKSYEDLLIERICRPLKMDDTRIALSAGHRRRLAGPHNADATKDSNWDLGTLAGAGGIRSTVDDMLRFLAANLEPDKTPLAAAIKFSHQFRYEMVKDKERIACGWHIRVQPGTWWHNGQTGGYHSFAAFRPRQRIAVVVLGNTATGAIDELGGLVMRLLAGEKAEPMPVRRFVRLDPAVLDRYVGRYHGLPTLDFQVTREGERLYVQLKGQPRVRVFAESETKFFYRVVDAAISFTVDADGKSNKLTLHQHGLDLPAWCGGLLGK